MQSDVAGTYDRYAHGDERSPFSSSFWVRARRIVHGLSSIGTILAMRVAVVIHYHS